MGDLFAGVRYDDEGRPFLDVVDETGEVVETHETASGIAATDDGSTIAYVDPDGVLWTQSDTEPDQHPRRPASGRVHPPRCCAARRTWIAPSGSTTATEPRPQRTSPRTSGSPRCRTR